MRLTSRFTEALEYARVHHMDDRRKGTEIPYLSHLLAVSSLALEHGGGETEAIAALLHDVVEDGGGESAVAEITSRFGAEVVAIVVGCSDTTAAVKEDWTLRKERYIDHLESAPPPVLLVSAADKLHNARAVLADLRELGDDLWARFNRGGREQLWYYGALRDTFLQRLPGRLSDELDRTVRNINRAVDIDDRIDWLGKPFALWCTSSTSGGLIDWNGWPLVVEKVARVLTVRVEVARGGDYCGDVDPDLSEYLGCNLEGYALEYRDASEIAWLVATDEGDLGETCHRVASLAPTVSKELLDLDLDLAPPLRGFDECDKRGPHW